MTPDDPAASPSSEATTSAAPGGGSRGPRELEVQLRFGDTDALGHVNNAAYATFAELGRIALMRSVSWADGGPILARLAIDFHAQVRLGSRVVVTTDVTGIRRSSITLHQEIYADDVKAATVSSVVVWFDYDAQRSVRVPDHVREALLDGEPAGDGGGP
jgi:acyl-CoA thioester hydrolase